MNCIHPNDRAYALERALAAATAQGEDRKVLEDLREILAEARQDARTVESSAAVAVARQPGTQACTNCDRTDTKIICQTCAGLAWDTGRLHEFNEIRELSTSLGEGGLDERVPEEWHDKPLLRFQGVYDCGDDSAGVPTRHGHVLATDQAGTVLGDYLVARAAKGGDQ